MINRPRPLAVYHNIASVFWTRVVVENDEKSKYYNNKVAACMWLLLAYWVKE